MNIGSFFKLYLKKPKEVSAWLPSLKWVSKKVASYVPAGSKNIVEYGPGGGTVLRNILAKVGPDANFLAIEILPEFVKELRKIKDSRLKIVESDVMKEIKNLKLESTDVILSSIPLSRLTASDREKLIKDSYDALRPGGRMIIYHQISRLTLPILKKYFKEVEWSFNPQSLTLYFILVATK
jgi:phospholipid N-methyltransferase